MTTIYITTIYKCIKCKYRNNSKKCIIFRLVSSKSGTFLFSKNIWKYNYVKSLTVRIIIIIS